MRNRRTIVLVLRNGGDFTFQDVELIARHINGKWRDSLKPRIICLWDKASQPYDLGNLEIIPLTNKYPGTWSRMALYSPEMEQYRPFLYVDLDTAIITSIEDIFDLVRNVNQFITLEDFWQKKQLATGLVWFPANSMKIRIVWNKWNANPRPVGFRMDYFLREAITADLYWQQLTEGVLDFKPMHENNTLLRQLPSGAQIVCFHGKPRIHTAAESIGWVRDYVEKLFYYKTVTDKKVTVIIPYNEDRGWLNAAIASVPDGVQLILSKGDGNWPENFNKVLKQATGDYIKYLHEDDMLTDNCIEDSVNAIEGQDVDFIHGNAFEIDEHTNNVLKWRPLVKEPSLRQLLKKNTIHSATLMYRRSVFEKVGLLNEDPIVNSFEEFEFNLRCLKAGLKIGYCPEFLAFYRRHPKQKIRVTSRHIREKNRNEILRSYV